MSYLLKSALIILSLLILLPGCATAPEKAKVIQIIDGDTIVIQGGYHVRYIGIDTPEEGQFYYEEAKEANQAMVGGKSVHLEKDVSNRDKYGRLLRYVYVDSLFVNAELVRQGYAYAESYTPDTRYQDILEEAERQARETGSGIWRGSS